MNTQIFLAILAIASVGVSCGGKTIAPDHGIVAYYKPQIAASASGEGQKNAADEKADLDTKRAQVTKAADEATAAEKAKAKDAATKRLRAKYLDAQLGQQYQQAQLAHAQHLSDRIERIVPAVRKAHGLDALIAAPPGSDLAPNVDLTAEIKHRLDNGEGKGDDELAAENQKLNARVTELEAALSLPSNVPVKGQKK